MKWTRDVRDVIRLLGEPGSPIRILAVVVPGEGLSACRECGCSDDRACPGGCWWIEPDLCSACWQ